MYSFGYITTNNDEYVIICGGYNCDKSEIMKEIYYMNLKTMKIKESKKTVKYKKM